MPVNNKVEVDNYSKDYGDSTHGIIMKDNIPCNNIKKYLFSGNTKGFKHASFSTQETVFDGKDEFGDKIKLTQVDNRYQVGNKIAVIKANGDVHTGSEAAMYYNMLPNSKITKDKFGDKEYYFPKIIEKSAFSSIKKANDKV